MCSDRRIVVAMSGGVDSCVSAYLLSKECKDLIGISMQVWDYRKNGGCESRATCCSPDDFTDARQVAANLGIPYYVFDFEQHFHENVIAKFVNTYKQGKTPNPCIDCNNKVKFRELKQRAESFGCTHVATGHYARIEERNGRYALLRGRDPDKDQSYFLYGLTQSDLSATIFPVGELTKPEVREIAASAGLAVASKPESQDICFISGDVSAFIERMSGAMPEGQIVDLQGKLLGCHQGIHRYTVGQRKGINISSTEPLYVLEIDPELNRIVVGPRSELETKQFLVEDLNWINLPEGKFQACAQLRHRHKGVEVEVEVKGNTALVSFSGDWSTVSPGQACVFYSTDNQEVLGGGRIQIGSKRNTILEVIQG